MKLNIPIPTTTFSVNGDLEKIRLDTGNPKLTADDVIVFKPSMIARTDVAANGRRFTAEALEKAAPTFIGNPINFDHEFAEAKKQIARVFDAWTDKQGEETFLFVNFYAIKTAEDADLHLKLQNRQHREQSMGIDLNAMVCQECKESVLPTLSCQDHPDSDCLITEFTGNHVSYVGDPAVKDAGVTLKSYCKTSKLNSAR